MLSKDTRRVSMQFPMLCMQFAIVRNAITDLYSVIRNELSSHYKPAIYDIWSTVPTLDCHTSRQGWEYPSSSITRWTVAPTSCGYGSPRSTTCEGV